MSALKCKRKRSLYPPHCGTAQFHRQEFIMDNFTKIIFIDELEKQCKFALNAVEQLNFSLEQLQPQNLESDKRKFFHLEVFRSIHSFLTHASNVSKILWPGLPEKKQNESDEDYQMRIRKLRKVHRAIELRKELGLGEEHILKKVIA